MYEQGIHKKCNIFLCEKSTKTSWHCSLNLYQGFCSVTLQNKALQVIRQDHRDQALRVSIAALLFDYSALCAILG